MLLKNISYQLSEAQGGTKVVEAVHMDTKTVTVIAPNQEVEVPDDEGQRFLERYPGHLVQIKERTPEAVLVSADEVIVEPVETPVVKETPPTSPNTCDVCGKVCISGQALLMHETSHR